MAKAPRVFVVPGEGSASAVPDRIRAQVALNVMAATAGDALAQVGDMAAAVIDVLRDEGAGQDDLETVGLRVHDFFDPAEQRVTARVATYDLTFTLADVDALGPALERLAALAGDSLQLHQFHLVVSDLEPATTLARQRAVADAQRRATELAAAAGVGLGPLLSLEEIGRFNRGPRGPQLAIRQVSKASGGLEVPVEAGAHTTTVQLSATFQISD